ncbi:MAG: LapA family protein [Halioglobus sp.]
MNLLRKLITLLVILAMIAIGVLFALQNTALVPLDLLVYSFEAKSVALWVLASFALGGLLGMLTASGIVLKLRTSLRTAKRQQAKTLVEMDKLRTVGLKDGE